MPWSFTAWAKSSDYKCLIFEAIWNTLVISVAAYSPVLISLPLDPTPPPQFSDNRSYNLYKSNFEIWWDAFNSQ